MLLENAHIKLRAVEPEDLELLYDWENMSDLWETGITRQPYSKFALKEYINQIHSDIYQSGQLRLMMVEKNTGKTVGTVDLYDFDIHNSRIALGLFVAPEYQGNGFAKSALQIIEEYVFSFLKINQLYCYISIHNEASISMFRKEYFTETTLKNWIKTESGFGDIIVFQQFMDDYNKRIV
ncbi:GNAT family N-acetyltransferase [Paludibacter sp.]